MNRKIGMYLFEFASGSDEQIYLPYAVGAVWSFAKTDPEIHEAFLLKGFHFVREVPHEIVASLDAPEVAAFSTYVWNWELSLAVAKRIKRAYPECLIIFGGPHVPNQAQGFFRKYPAVDVLVHGEGEETFTEILRARARGEPIAGIRGTTVHIGGGEQVTGEGRERISDFSRVVSPYLSGTFDDLLALPIVYNAVWETNRGCPYSCTFCDWGALASKLRVFPMERLLAEMEFFGEHRLAHIWCGDSNFGIIERDLQIAEHLVRVKSRTGFPKRFETNYAKNSTDRVMQIAELLQTQELNYGITLSVQSMDADTLKIIKRRNMKVDSLSGFAHRYKKKGIEAYTEVILGLPGESYETFADGVDTLLAAGLHHSVWIYRCSVLPNAELNDPIYRRVHEIETVRTPYCPIHTAPEKDPVVEYENIVISTRTMPHADWKRSNLFAWAVQCFHALNLTQVVAVFAHELSGVSYRVFYERLLDSASRNPDSRLGESLRMVEARIAHVLLEGGTWGVVLPEICPISWALAEATYLRLTEDPSAFYDEIEAFVETMRSEGWWTIDARLTRDVLLYQRALVVKWNQDGTQALDLGHNVHGFYRGVLEGDDIPLRDTPSTVSIEDDRRFLGDRARYAIETVLFGRRLGRSVYQKVSETPQREPARAASFSS
jgi:radical SAM superfamily enzyme YgiQ (UPF0313 family)